MESFPKCGAMSALKHQAKSVNERKLPIDAKPREPHRDKNTGQVKWKLV